MLGHPLAFRVQILDPLSFLAFDLNATACIIKPSILRAVFSRSFEYGLHRFHN